MIRSPSATMNSSRDRAENIIDELQAFLNSQQSQDDSLASPNDLDLDLSQSFVGGQTEVRTTWIDGRDISERSGNHLDQSGRNPESFYLPDSLPTSDFQGLEHSEDLASPSELAGSSEVFMSSGGTVSVKESYTFSSSVNVAKHESVDVKSGSVLKEMSVVDSDVGGISAVNGELETRHREDHKNRDVTSFTGLSKETSEPRKNDEKGDKTLPVTQTFDSDVKTKTASAVVTASTKHTLTTSSVHQENGTEATHHPADFLMDSTAAETGEVETRKIKTTSSSATPPPPTTDDVGQSNMTGYDFLESFTPPPPPREVKDSASIPFPMIFRRSKKDPGSRQYKELVKELEEVLNKRSKVRRTSSLRDINTAVVPEVVGTLQGTKKLSSSTENLSVFSNKVLLNHLESHLKRRNQPGQDRMMGAGRGQGEGEGLQKGIVISPQVNTSKIKTSSSSSSSSSPEQQTSKTVVNGHIHVESSSGKSVDSAAVASHGQMNGHTNIHVGGSHSDADSHSSGDTAVSVIQVTADPRSSPAGRPLLQSHTMNRVRVTSPLHSPSDYDGSSHEMSFGSEDEFSSSSHHATTLPAHGVHYRKHITRTNTSHVHPSRTNPNVLYKTQSLDSNFQHITRIAVSRSEESLPACFRSHQPSSSEQDTESSSFPWTVERQNASPMKTIVEHFTETDPEEVAAWNAAIRNSKKHKEKGLYRSISQRMVQKMYRFVRPKSAGNTLPSSSSSSSAVSRSKLFNNPAALQDSVMQQSPSSIFGTSENHILSHTKHGGVFVKLPNHQKLNSAGLDSPSRSMPDISLHSSQKENLLSKDFHGHAHTDPAHSVNGYVTVQLPNSAKGSAMAAKNGSSGEDYATSPISPTKHVTTIQSKELRYLAQNTESHSYFRHSVVSGHVEKDSNVVVDLPNHHKATIVPNFGGSLSMTKQESVSGHIERNRDVIVDLPNHHKATIVPNLGGNVSMVRHLGSSSGHIVHHDSDLVVDLPNHHKAIIPKLGGNVSMVKQQGASFGHVVGDSGVVVDLPNHHTATIVPTMLGGNVSMVKQASSSGAVALDTRSAARVVRSTSYRQTYRPSNSQGSPFTQEIGEGLLPPAHGDGLHRGEEDKAATFFIDTRGMAGEPFVQVDGPNSIAKCSIESQPDGQYMVTYIPVEVGMFDVMVKYNGKELPGSPYHPKVVCARKVLVVGGWQHYMDNRERVHLMVNEEKTIPFDVSDAGPGKMTAEVKSPSGLIPVTVDDSTVGRSTVIFTPREEGIHSIYLYWSDTPLTSSPFQGYATGGVLDPTKVILTGRGLKEAIVQEEAEFIIDASHAGHGDPEVQLTGVRAEVSVFVTPLGGGKFRCTYIPVVPGAYLLHISWNGRQLRGSPYKVNIMGAFYPNKVVVSGEGLKGGLLGRDFDIRIDTRKAGPGELTAYCVGPSKVAHCELEDHHDGTFRLIVRPQESGRHVLQVKYGGDHVLGSPFDFKVSAQPDASKVRVSGPGVEHGILATFQSRFVVETRGAGAGQLTVRIRGPKGAFQVEMYRDSQKDRTILCRYDPVETGLYIISIRWSGVDVPGSPFHIHILDTQSELEQVLADQSFHNASFHSSRAASGYGQWREEF